MEPAANLGAQLIDLIEGRPMPAQPSPLIVTDLVLLLLAVGVVVLPARGARRSRQRADRGRAGPAALARMAPYLLPLMLALALHRVVGFLVSRPRHLVAADRLPQTRPSHCCWRSGRWPAS
ncbi:hypothetical protein ABZ570_26950 [Micromonospora sp. NPDC007271]|uniref:hypothetical protein n=1 Tax=Micromonospora sp. NPDC007271 TaxID=3154587 RepID=UPI0033C480AE